jgi:divalent metal cation (Fe/Co/Zn/Cd) transporter
LVQRGLKENDELHPFGYGREEFLGFYGGDTIIFSVVLFFQYMKVHKLMEPIAIKNIGWGLF